MTTWHLLLLVAVVSFTGAEAGNKEVLNCFDKIPHQNLAGKYAAKTEIWGATLYRCLELCLKAKGNAPTNICRAVVFDPWQWSCTVYMTDGKDQMGFRLPEYNKDLYARSSMSGACATQMMVKPTCKKGTEYPAFLKSPKRKFGNANNDVVQTYNVSLAQCKEGCNNNELKGAVIGLTTNVQFMCRSFNYINGMCEIHTAYGLPEDKDGSFTSEGDSTYHELVCLPNKVKTACPKAEMFPIKTKIRPTEPPFKTAEGLTIQQCLQECLSSTTDCLGISFTFEKDRLGTCRLLGDKIDRVFDPGTETNNGNDVYVDNICKTSPNCEFGIFPSFITRKDQKFLDSVAKRVKRAITGTFKISLEECKKACNENKLKNDVFLCQSFNYKDGECEIHDKAALPDLNGNKLASETGSNYHQLICLPDEIKMRCPDNFAVPAQTGLIPSSAPLQDIPSGEFIDDCVTACLLNSQCASVVYEYGKDFTEPNCKLYGTKLGSDDAGTPSNNNNQVYVENACYVNKPTCDKSTQYPAFLELPKQKFGNANNDDVRSFDITLAQCKEACNNNQLQGSLVDLPNNVTFMCRSFNYISGRCEIHTAYGIPDGKDGSFSAEADSTYHELVCLPNALKTACPKSDMFPFKTKIRPTDPPFKTAEKLTIQQCLQECLSSATDCLGISFTFEQDRLGTCRLQAAKVDGFFDPGTQTNDGNDIYVDNICKTNPNCDAGVFAAFITRPDSKLLDTATKRVKRAVTGTFKISLEECKKACNDNKLGDDVFLCQSFNYKNGECETHNIIALPESRGVNLAIDRGSSYNQLICVPDEIKQACPENFGVPTQPGVIPSTAPLQDIPAGEFIDDCITACLLNSQCASVVYEYGKSVADPNCKLYATKIGSNGDDGLPSLNNNQLYVENACYFPKANCRSDEFAAFRLNVGQTVNSPPGDVVRTFTMSADDCGNSCLQNRVPARLAAGNADVIVQCAAVNFHADTNKCEMHAKQAAPVGVGVLSPDKDAVYTAKMCLKKTIQPKCVPSPLFISFSGRIPPGRVLETSREVNKERCTERCINHPDCQSATFNFAKTGNEDNCQLHEFKLKNSADGTAAADGKQVLYIEEGCSPPGSKSDHECPIETPPAFFVTINYRMEAPELTPVVWTNIDTQQCIKDCSNNKDRDGNPVSCATANFDAVERVCYIYDKLPHPNGPGEVVSRPNTFLMGEKFCLPSFLKDKERCRDNVFFVDRDKEPIAKHQATHVNDVQNMAECIGLCVLDNDCKAVAFYDDIESLKQNCKLYDESPGDMPGELVDRMHAFVVANGCRITSRALLQRRAAVLAPAIQEEIVSKPVRYEAEKKTIEEKLIVAQSEPTTPSPIPWGTWSPCQFTVKEQKVRARTRECEIFDCPPGSIQLQKCE